MDDNVLVMLVKQTIKRWRLLHNDNISNEDIFLNPFFYFSSKAVTSVLKSIIESLISMEN